MSTKGSSSLDVKGGKAVNLSALTCGNPSGAPEITGYATARFHLLTEVATPANLPQFYTHSLPGLSIPHPSQIFERSLEILPALQASADFLGSKCVGCVGR